MNSCENMLRAH